jgi:transposase
LQKSELGELNRREVAALVGVAPFNRDSGRMRGKRGNLRWPQTSAPRALYGRARGGAPQPDPKQFLSPLRAAGNPAKLALTATMRKLLIVLNSALKPDLSYA